jgi:hypothetical protein
VLAALEALVMLVEDLAVEVMELKDLIIRVVM